MIKKSYEFAKEIVEKLFNNDLLTHANAMTYKLLLAIFPLLIVMIASLAFFNIDVNELLSGFLLTLPKEMRVMIENVIYDVFTKRHISLLSTSIIVSLYSAAAGFVSMIEGMNKAFGSANNLGIIRSRLICLVLVLVFIILIVLSLAMLIFRDIIASLLNSIGLDRFIPATASSIFLLLIAILVGIIFLIILHKVAVGSKLPVKYILPGAFFTVGTWLIASKVFNYYVNNFSRYSIVYGSIGAFFVFALWLNILSYVILIGSQINAVLYERFRYDEALAEIEVEATRL